MLLFFFSHSLSLSLTHTLFPSLSHTHSLGEGCWAISLEWNRHDPSEQGDPPIIFFSSLSKGPPQKIQTFRESCNMRWKKWRLSFWSKRRCSSDKKFPTVEKDAECRIGKILKDLNPRLVLNVTCLLKRLPQWLVNFQKLKQSYDLRWGRITKEPSSLFLYCP